MNVLRPKDPHEVVNYTINFAPDLGADTISGATVAVTGATKVSDSNTDTTVTFVLSEGTAGEIAYITTTVTTVGGLTFESYDQVAIISNQGVTPSTGYTRPTVVEFITMYPAFASVSAATIQMWLDRAPVDETWIEADFAPAIMAWAAHTMTGYGIGASEIAVYAAAGVSRLKSGTLDVSFAAGSQGGAGYSATAYGRDWLELLRRNKGGPRVVVGPRGCATGWAATGICNDGRLVPWDC